jgi:pyruvate dehydrogenase E2 component (dihydrolipoamide acetyltransferase)
VSRLPIERDGEIVLAHQLQVTLSCDHRAIDGALGARFLTALDRFLASPERL